MRSGNLRGPRYEIDLGELSFPKNLQAIENPPQRLFVIGNPEALKPGLAVIGARKATPYGLSCARRFARIAAEKGVCIISGGARGCDAEAHRAALDAGSQTVCFLGGGCDCLYPAEHFGLFQAIIDAGGAMVSEREWGFKPLPYTFRERNRLIAGLAEAVLIVEAGLPSGTFSTADAALSSGKDVLVVPGAITSASSHGSNRLLYDGALPVVDDDTFEDVLFCSLGMLKRPSVPEDAMVQSPIVEAVLAAPTAAEDLLSLARRVYGEADALAKMMEELGEAEAERIVARQPDGKWGPVLRG